jgi:Skp family chaperone for outer membrane proteins
MKKRVLLILFALCIASAAPAADRIVFIDLERTFNEFYKTELSKARVELQQREIQEERQQMVDELEAISEEVDILKKEARDVTLTEEIRDGKRLLYEERLLEMRAKQKEIEEFTQRRQQQLQIQVNRMSQSVMDEIREAVVDFAKTEGFDAVIDKSDRKAAVGVFIYTHSSLDITDQVLTFLNSRRPDLSDDPEADAPVIEFSAPTAEEGEDS